MRDRFQEAVKEWLRAYRLAAELVVAIETLEEKKQELMAQAAVNEQRLVEAEETVDSLLQAIQDVETWHWAQEKLALAVGEAHAQVMPEDVIRIDVLGEIFALSTSPSETGDDDDSL